MAEERSTADTLLSIGAWILIALSGVSMLSGASAFVGYLFFKSLGEHFGGPTAFQDAFARYPVFYQMILSRIKLIFVGRSILSLTMCIGAVGLLKRLKWGLWIVRILLVLGLLCYPGAYVLWAKSVREMALAGVSAVLGVVGLFGLGLYLAIVWLSFLPSVRRQFEREAISARVASR